VVHLTVWAVIAAYLTVFALVIQLVQAHSLPGWTTSPLPWLLGAILILGGVGAWRIGNVRPAADPETTLRRSGIVAGYSLVFPVFILIVLHIWLVAARPAVAPADNAASKAPQGGDGPSRLRGQPPGGDRPTARAQGPITPPNHYGAVIDAGSSGSRIAVFEWRIAGAGDPHVSPVVAIDDDQLDAAQRDPGASREGRKPRGCPLTSLPTEGDRVCSCLRALTTRAREAAVRFLGEPDLQPIDLWVKATAGVRYEKSQDRRNAILDATGQCLGDPAGYGAADAFRWKGARVISGEEEGLYAWLAVNHAARTLRGDIDGTLGIVEIGGRSAQIAFRVPEPAPGASARGKALAVPLKSGRLHVYAMSQEFGQNAAREGIGTAVVERECALGGGTEACVAKIRRFLCAGAPGRECGNLKPEFTPPGKMHFAGLSNFAYATRNLGLADLALDTVGDRARRVCDSSYGRSLRSAYLNPGAETVGDARLMRLGQGLGNEFARPAGHYKSEACFSALYVTQVAEFAWGLPLANISPPEPASASDPSWPLGAMIVEALGSQAPTR